MTTRTWRMAFAMLKLELAQRRMARAELALMRAEQALARAQQSGAIEKGAPESKAAREVPREGR
jgi:hypothetical protein